MFNPLNAEINPICHLLALLGAHHILHVSRIRVKNCPLQLRELHYELQLGKVELRIIVVFNAENHIKF